MIKKDGPHNLRAIFVIITASIIRLFFFNSICFIFAGNIIEQSLYPALIVMAVIIASFLKLFRLQENSKTYLKAFPVINKTDMSGMLLFMKFV